MSNHIDFYFDIISPYAYIAHKKILKNKNIIFNYKPVYLGGLHKLAGIDSPAFNKYKLKNNINDCNLVSEKNNIEFKWNSNFPINSLNIMRGYISVSKDKQNDYLNCFFDAYWKDNYDLSNAENMSKLAVAALDKAAQKGSLHKNNVSRRKSRLHSALNKAKN